MKSVEVFRRRKYLDTLRMDRPLSDINAAKDNGLVAIGCNFDLYVDESNAYSQKLTIFLLRNRIKSSTHDNFKQLVDLWIILSSRGCS